MKKCLLIYDDRKVAHYLLIRFKLDDEEVISVDAFKVFGDFIAEFADLTSSPSAGGGR